MQNKGLIIFIGECFRFGSQNSRVTDTIESYEKQKNATQTHINLINLIHEKYDVLVDVVINSYETKYKNDIFEWYNCDNRLKKCIFNEKKIGIEGLLKIVSTIDNVDNYLFLFICRIDLFLKKYFFEIFNPFDKKIFFPSVCMIGYHICNCKKHPRINDTMLFVPNIYIKIIKKYIHLDHQSWCQYNKLYNFNNENLNVYLDTFHDSDSEKDYNPLYFMTSRNESNVWHSIGYVLNKQNMTENVNLDVQFNYLKNTKKMALLFYGIHYEKKYQHPSKKTYDIDARLYYKNIKIKMIDYFEKFYKIDIFICSNESNLKNDLLKLYNPVRYHFDSSLSKIQKIIKILKMLIDYIDNQFDRYDVIMMSRLDIYFMKNFLNINFEKFNNVSILEHKKACDDNFYLFPIKYLHDFYNLIINQNYNDILILHHIKNLLEKKFNVNYICNENDSVPNLSFFKLRFFDNIDFNLDKYLFSDNVWYKSLNNNAEMLKNEIDNIIYFKKINHYRCNYCWIGYEIKNIGNYNLIFDIMSNKDIINFNYIKTHKPEQYYTTNNIYSNTLTSINIMIKITNNDDLFVIIFDDFYDTIDIQIKNLQINKIL